MRRKRRIVAGGITLGFAFILIGFPLWIVDRTFLREQATHELAVAVYKNDTQDTLAALRAGADPNTRQSPTDSPPTLTQFLQQFWRQMRGEKPPAQSSLVDRPPLLAFAAAKNNTDVVRGLLQEGAKPDASVHYEKGTDYDENDTTEGKTECVKGSETKK